MTDKRNNSTSCLSTEKRNLTKGNSTEFSIDLAMIHEDLEGTWYRLIHKKTCYDAYYKWIWNVGPNSKGLTEIVKWLKDNNLWNEVRDTYLNKKNMYPRRNDNNYPSFNCYIEAVNEVYNKN